ncbi:MAG: 5'-nucleotidase C-terminal domain-containing protein [Holophagaceae bacterium]|nr:5'-nucleotidase C-terminal domain-containing protein [Holophagaceae bacterium]
MKLDTSILALILALAPLACQKVAPAPLPKPAPAASALVGDTKAAPRLLQAQSVGVVQEFADDPAIMAVLAPRQAEIKATFDLPLCACPKGLFRGRNGEENLLGYWVTDTMRARAARLAGKPVKFAMTNSGGLRANLPPGQLKVSDIYGVMPFENELVTIEMTGQDVMDAIKQGILHRGSEPSSGVKVVLSGTVDKPDLLITWEDGTAIKPDEVVTAATTDYLYNGGDAIPALKNGRRPFTTGVAMRQMLLDACGDLAKAGKPLEAPPLGRYNILPELYAAAREHKLGK